MITKDRICSFQIQPDDEGHFWTANAALISRQLFPDNHRAEEIFAHTLLCFGGGGMFEIFTTTALEISAIIYLQGYAKTFFQGEPCTLLDRKYWHRSNQRKNKFKKSRVLCHASSIPVRDDRVARARLLHVPAAASEGLRLQLHLLQALQQRTHV